MLSPIKLLVLSLMFLCGATAQSIDYWTTTVFALNATTKAINGGGSNLGAIGQNLTIASNGIKNLTMALNSSNVMTSAQSQAYLANATNLYEPALRRMANAFVTNKTLVQYSDIYNGRYLCQYFVNITRNSSTAWFGVIFSKSSSDQVQTAKNLAAKVDSEWAAIVSAYKP